MTSGKSLTTPLGSLIVKDAMRQAGVRSNLPAVAPSAVRVPLGDIQPVQGNLEDSATGRQVLANIEAVRAAALQGAARFTITDALNNRRAQTVAMSFLEYKDAIKRDRQILSDYEREARRSETGNRYLVPFDKVEVFRFLTQIYNRTMHTPSFQGYLNYVSAVHPSYISCLQRVAPPALDERAREQHTYITGGTGSGKTELMKALALHDIRQGDRAVVIIDPQSNFSGTVARWREFAGEGADRLVYFDPTLCRGLLPGLNPLDMGHLSKRDRSVYAGQLSSIMGQVVSDKGERWTPQTETVAHNCFEVALNTRGATFRHIRRALVEVGEKEKRLPPMVAEIVRLGRKHHSEDVRTFFQDDFFRQNYVSSKNSFGAKLGAALRNPIFADVTCRQTTIHLEKMINDKKIIIFNLGAWGDLKAAGAFGRMVIAQIVAIGMRRATAYGGEKVPVHVYVDEADKFIGPSALDALSKLRQHRVHMTMAQTVFGEGLEPDEKRSLSTNTGVKFTAGGSQGEMLSVMFAPSDATKGFETGQFLCRWGFMGELFRLQVRNDLSGQKNCMTNAEWEAVTAHQLAQYYATAGDLADDYGLDAFSFDLGSQVDTLDPGEDEDAWPLD